jgi:hypothetical protein
MNAPDVLRTAQINLKLTPEERERLERLASHLALTEQSVLRLLVKRASDEFDREGRWPVDAAPARAPAPAPKKTRRARK